MWIWFQNLDFDDFNFKYFLLWDDVCGFFIGNFVG